MAKTKEPRTAAVNPAGGGFILKGKHLFADKPTDTWKARFYALRRGMGYPIELLQEEWGKGGDTIREHAKRYGALRYVEASNKPGEYLACAVHPDTPKGK